MKNCRSSTSNDVSIDYRCASATLNLGLPEMNLRMLNIANRSITIHGLVAIALFAFLPALQAAGFRSGKCVLGNAGSDGSEAGCCHAEASRNCCHATRCTDDCPAMGNCEANLWIPVRSPSQSTPIRLKIASEFGHFRGRIQSTPLVESPTFSRTPSLIAQHIRLQI